MDPGLLEAELLDPSEPVLLYVDPEEPKLEVDPVLLPLEEEDEDELDPPPPNKLHPDWLELVRETVGVPPKFV